MSEGMDGVWVFFCHYHHKLQLRIQFNQCCVCPGLFCWRQKEDLYQLYHNSRFFCCSVQVRSRQWCVASTLVHSVCVCVRELMCCEILLHCFRTRDISPRLIFSLRHVIGFIEADQDRLMRALSHWGKCTCHFSEALGMWISFLTLGLLAFISFLLQNLLSVSKPDERFRKMKHEAVILPLSVFFGLCFPSCVNACDDIAVLGIDFAFTSLDSSAWKKSSGQVLTADSSSPGQEMSRSGGDSDSPPLLNQFIQVFSFHFLMEGMGASAHYLFVDATAVYFIFCSQTLKKAKKTKHFHSAAFPLH